MTWKDTLIKILEGNNLWINTVFLLLAILGILATIITFFKNKKTKSCVFNKATFNLIDDNISSINKLNVKFDNNEIKNLSISYVAIWNNGNDIINKNDFATLEPLKLVVSNNNIIYDCKIYFINNKVNNFSTDFINNEIKINFDYFANNEGIIVQVYHSGRKNKDIKINGIIKGVGTIKQGGFEKDKFKNKGFDIMFGWLFNIFGRIIPNKKLKTSILTIILILPYLITFPITFILLITDSFGNYFNKVPKEYKFENINTAANNS
ncbi:MAG: hypothetical protein K8R54_09925 [Bacteroidales bacterium]|nr:hypothetical protein [Bacteroidales bacterium]